MDGSGLRNTDVAPDDEEWVGVADGQLFDIMFDTDTDWLHEESVDGYFNSTPQSSSY